MRTFRPSLIAAAAICLYAQAPAMAMELPAHIKATVQAANMTIGSDGSVTAGTARYVPLVPADYSPGTTPEGAPVVNPDGSVSWSGLQFVPIVSTPGEMPHFPDNLQTSAGLALPSDFSPPAGFIPSASTPLPSGVSVPPLSVKDMLQQMEQAGALAPGQVKVNNDGTISVGSSSNYLPFTPPAAQQGLARDPSQRGITSDAKTGAVTFPDGSTYAPLVTGSAVGGQTLPSGFTPPSGTSLPAGVSLPLQFEIPSTMPIPAGMTLPAGVVIPENYTLPTGTVLPAGANVPTSVTMAEGVSVPAGIMLPAGSTFTTGTALPQGTTILPNGSMVIPGNQIPAGVTPGSNWTPPTGATKGSDGGWSLPTVPQRGFLPPPMPIAINSDGSAVFPFREGDPTPPPGSTINPDGTVTIPPPPFIGSIGSGGTVSGPGFGVNAPTGFTPSLPPGTTMPGAGGLPPGVPPPTGGGTPPSGGGTPPSGGGTPPSGGGGTPPPGGGGTPPPR